MYVEYDSNNSGGHWWLKDEDWKALEAAGWIVAWASLEYQYNEQGNHLYDNNGVPKLVQMGEGNSRFPVFVKQDKKGEYRKLGTLATTAYRSGLSLREAAAEWEKITGHDAAEAGCPCCGQPHTFTEYDDNGKYVKSGPVTSYKAS